MKDNARNVYFLDRGETLAKRASTGVSLHCHTLHSKEQLDFVPFYAERIPVASFFWRREMRRHQRLNSRLPDFKTGYWTPPLSGHEVFEMERNNLQRLNLEAIVSITDHDSINSNLELQRDIDIALAPISLEWTVPFENAYFHLGVHNLPAERAAAITTELLDYTYAPGEPDNKRLGEIFAMLNSCREVLIVFNHPIWDIEMIGQQAHEIALRRFVEEHIEWIHAIEINGFRSWSENQAAIELAAAEGLPIISGGDRHCCQSNTMFNLTSAHSFDEFVNEIRFDHHSQIAVAPEYNDALPTRQLRSIAQIIANYRHLPEGRRLWTDRIHLDFQDGNGLRTLTEHWNGRQPAWTNVAFLVLSILTHPVAQPFISMTIGDTDIGRDERRTANKGFHIGDSPLMVE